MESLMIRELALDERPRERLLEHGTQALSDAELLAVLLRTGRRGASALDVGRELLRVAGGLAGLRSLRAGAKACAGLGHAKLATVLAAVEIGRRLARLELPERVSLAKPREVADYLVMRYCASQQEVMGALFLDVRNRLIGEREIFRGTINRTAVEPRAVLKEAILRDALALLLFHTHPSGDPSPSAEDFLFTRRMAEAADTVGLRLVDHMILGGCGRWVSLRERRPW